ncbi:ABC transporter ATP-binding protein [Geothrix sp. PMB-07]|uniref:ABC transporter ATP-binding protein n=1 Tax=Geothrix sp. PMB-07 TaxID=3068640 RepID=UPI00274162EB|nr:ABC transporter ATP-binding protein [Geothrix sp. PMB-07]WLT30140.1 ABC transporter ATP-binding protein [Geothrix sp. PMB-07]
MSLTINGLVLHRTDGVRLLGPLSLCLHPGDRVGLVGESGSGKSLLVHALFRALPRGVVQTAGESQVFGTLVSQIQGEDPTLGGRMTWVPQDPRAALNPMLTLGEHLALLPGFHRRERPGAALARLKPLLEQLGLPTDQGLLGRFPHQASGGQRQRICLAMALSCDPELLVLDEPTTALDPLAQREFLNLALSLQRERGLGFLWITHDLALAAEACDRLLVMYGGEAMEAGPTRVVLARPRHPYTARLLSAARQEPSTDAGYLPAPQHRLTGCPFQPRCLQREDSCATWGAWSADGDVDQYGVKKGFGLRCEHPL